MGNGKVCGYRFLVIVGNLDLAIVEGTLVVIVAFKFAITYVYAIEKKRYVWPKGKQLVPFMFKNIRQFLHDAEYVLFKPLVLVRNAAAGIEQVELYTFKGHALIVVKEQRHVHRLAYTLVEKPHELCHQLPFII